VVKLNYTLINLFRPQKWILCLEVNTGLCFSVLKGVDKSKLLQLFTP